MKIKFYSLEIEKFISGLEKPTIAKVLRTFDLLERFGGDLGMPHVRKLRKGLFELRVRGQQEVRFLFIFRGGGVIIVLSGFVKKTRKISVRELKKALRRKDELDEV